MSIGTHTVTISTLENRVLAWTIDQLKEDIEQNAPYELVYVDRGDQLTEEQIVAYIQDDYESLDESMWEWIADQRAESAVEIIKDQLREIQRYDGDALVSYLIEKNYIAQYSEEENEAVEILIGLDHLDVDPQDDLRMLIEEHDESNPIKELARATNSVLFRTTLIDGESGWSQDEEGIEEIAGELVDLCRGTLNIIDAIKIARDLSDGWDTLHEGIDLDCLWYGDIETAHNGNLKGLEFTHPWLLMVDRWNGTGNTVHIEHEVHLFTTPSNTTRLDAKCAGYNWQQIAGPVESTYAPDFVEFRTATTEEDKS